jgi:hypothetical protein
VEEAGGLAAQVDGPDRRLVALQHRSLPRQRDRALDKGAQFFRLRQGRDDALVARVNERSREVAQHRHAVLGRSPQLTVCF